MHNPLPKVINPRYEFFKTMPIIVGMLCRRISDDYMHIHDCTELWYALSGDAIHKVGDMTFHQAPGTCVAVPSFVPHDIYTYESEDTPVFLAVNVFDNALRERGYDYFSYCDKRIYFDGKLLPIFHKFSGAEQEKANDIAHKLSDEFSKHKELNFDKLFDLYACFLQLLGGKKTSFKPKASILKRAESILSAAGYISSHYSEKITIEKLCEVANMSRSRFSEYFTEITGVPAMHYLKCLRMSVAQKEFMLRGKNLSDIVKLTGVYDKSQLSRMFKQHYGISLSEYRNEKQLRELRYDQEIRQRIFNLNELNEFFKKRDKIT